MKLSVCIPTRNRSKTLSDTLDSALSQNFKNLEIVVVDGASEDNTEDIINKYKKKYKNIIYYKRSKCVGVDKDILKSIEIASSKYCWLMSDDDHFQKNSFIFVEQYLEKNPNLSGLTTNYQQFDKNLSFPIKTVPAIIGNKKSENLFFDNPEKCFSTLGFHMGFLSCQIINREIWLKTIKDIDIKSFQNNWLMVFIIGNMINKENPWGYLHKIMINQRTGNDSFAQSGVYERELITHQYFADILENLFGKNSLVHKKIFHFFNVERLPRIFANLKSQNISFEIQLKLLSLYLRKYKKYLPFWVNVFPLFLIPNRVFTLVKKIYFNYRSKKSLL